MKALCIDFETANQSPRSVCALGMTVIEEGRITDTWYSLIRPPAGHDSFNPFNVAIHGIRPGDVAAAPGFHQIYPEIAPLINESILVAHNASFDIGVLRQSLDHFAIDYPEVPYLCTCKLARKVWPALPNHKLNTLADYLNYRFLHHHAGEDATACAQVFLACLQQLNLSRWDHLLDEVPLTPGQLFPGGYHPCSVRKPQRNPRR